MLSSAPASGTLGRQVFNAARFAAQTLGDARVQDQLAAVFLRDAATVAAEIAASRDADPQAFAELLHRLMNTAHFIAGDRLLDAVVRADSDGSAATADRRAAAATAIGHEFALLREALAQRARAAPLPDRLTAR